MTRSKMEITRNVNTVDNIAATSGLWVDLDSGIFEIHVPAKMNVIM